MVGALHRRRAEARCIVKPWSLARNPSNINYEPFAVLPTITLADETAAWKWLQQRMRVVRKTLNDRVLHFVGAGQAQITKQDVDAYLTRRGNETWDTLKELARDMNGMWIIQINENNWRASQCSCPHFAKNYMFKHVIGLSVQLQLHTLQTQAKNVPVSEKRKRSRPLVACQALVRM